MSHKTVTALQAKVNQLQDDDKDSLLEKLIPASENNQLSKELTALKEEHDSYVAETIAAFHRKEEDYSNAVANFQDEVKQLERENAKLRADCEWLREQMGKEENQSKKFCRVLSMQTPETQEMIMARYNFNSCQFDDLEKIYMWCLEHQIAPHVIKYIFSLDTRTRFVYRNNMTGEAGGVTTQVFNSFFYTVLPALPNLQRITDQDWFPAQIFVSYKRYGLSKEVFEEHCGKSPRKVCACAQPQLDTLQCEGISLKEYFSTVIPLMKCVTAISVRDTYIDTLDWCPSLPESITEIDICGCHNIADFTPLVYMKGLKKVVYNGKTDSSFELIKGQLLSKEVEVRDEDHPEAAEAKVTEEEDENA
ncbi:hypothetical protein AGDE_15040 [Angomonas deanei]|uniref:Uncharacterized protein n=1 Tax=Angomonas deanei TaxID=59799 RepID=A0A7G2CEC1_9TRYP|nr:hypothetical protein AGDE_15040 [Angomonas deanei]CAD2217224.1 hypothetical protein, conserved [Angomonas deanei]|eukprot:EPY19784.1 hypothetical protein AGDE_15040 [Angomonas deanei]